nr:gamma-glutamylcyclotransferase [Actinopolymorpha rutila]
MADRCPHSPLRGTGWMTGWRLTFGGEDHGWEGALPTVVEDPVSEVFVALYDLAPADEDRLDDWEGASLGLYRKVRVWVQTLDGGASATSYVLDAFEGGLPSARYLGILAEAADLAGAPSDYTAALRRRPCRGIGH